MWHRQARIKLTRHTGGRRPNPCRMPARHCYHRVRMAPTTLPQGRRWFRPRHLLRFPKGVVRHRHMAATHNAVHYSSLHSRCSGQSSVIRTPRSNNTSTHIGGDRCRSSDVSIANFYLRNSRSHSGSEAKQLNAVCIRGFPSHVVHNFFLKSLWR